jgi:hypothetical protein
VEPGLTAAITAVKRKKVKNRKLKLWYMFLFCLRLFFQFVLCNEIVNVVGCI